MMTFEGKNLSIFSHYPPTNATWKMEQIITSFPIQSGYDFKYLVLPLQ